MKSAALRKAESAQGIEPEPNCGHCDRLVAFRHDNQVEYPEFFNGAVPAFGSLDAALLVVGLAPGLKGANRTGRPFTGDYAGLLLYPALIRHGFANGTFGESANDGLALVNARITNAVRCVPPQNKPTTQEMTQCLPYLTSELQAMPQLKVMLALGRIAHQSVLKACGLRQSAFAFAHGAEHKLQLGGRSVTLINSYHCSRYNVNTGRLNESMFDAVMARAALLTHEAVTS